jgi:hypothetical protein
MNVPYAYCSTYLIVEPDKFELSPNFQDRLRSALSWKTDNQKRDALNKLFADFGHVFPSKIILGGSIVKITSQFVKSTIQLSETKENLSFSLATGIFGSATAAIGKSTAAKNEETTSHESEAIHVTGGDITLSPVFEKWAASVQSCELPISQPLELWTLIVLLISNYREQLESHQDRKGGFCHRHFKGYNEGGGSKPCPCPPFQTITW